MSEDSKFQIYVRLFNESTDVWRPVWAFQIDENEFEILQTEVPESEEWEFQPGAKVRCKIHHFDEGMSGLVAIALVDP